MTYGQALTLKPGDLICHNACLYWYDMHSNRLLSGKWDVCTNRNFLIISITHSSNTDKPVNATRSCGGDAHDFQYLLLHEGTIINAILCPKNIQLLSGGDRNDA